MLHDPRYIDDLIKTGRAALAEARGPISESLLFFSDPRAQAAAEEILPGKDKHAVAVWREDIKNRGTRALFPW